MRQVVAVLFFLLLAAHAFAKNSKKTLLRVHVQENQESLNEKNQPSEESFQVGQFNGSLQVWVAMVVWDDRTVSATLDITNPGKESILLVPSQLVVFLPNGHSYRPFNRADVLEQAYALKNQKRAQTYSGYNPPPVTSFTSDCSLNGSTASCRTTADQSTQAGYAVGFALGAAIKTAIADRTFNKYIKQVQDEYLVSQQIAPGARVAGYVDFYVEDTHGGPFTLRVPAGGTFSGTPAPGKMAEQRTTYDFVFGPELITVDLAKDGH